MDLEEDKKKEKVVKVLSRWSTLLDCQEAPLTKWLNLHFFLYTLLYDASNPNPNHQKWKVLDFPAFSEQSLGSA